jgi:hypothetical protein
MLSKALVAASRQCIAKRVRWLPAPSAEENRRLQQFRFLILAD